MSLRWASPYQPARSCTGGPQPGARNLLAVLLAAFPGTWSGGIYNCRTVRGSSTTSLHGEGRAVDIMVPLGSDGRGSALGHRLVRELGKVGRELGIQLVIYDRRSWSAVYPNGRRYNGVHPHYDHLHIELTWDAARHLTQADIRRVLLPPPTPTTPTPTTPPPAPKTFLEEIAAMDPKDRQKLIGEIADAVHKRTVTTHYPDGAEQLRADTLWARATIASTQARDAARAAAAGVPVDVIEKMRQVQEALAAEVVAQIRRDTGRPADPASDRVWVERLAEGTHTVADARRALGK